MKAVVLTRYGDAENLVLREVDDPAVKRGQVLVRVAATSVNPVDFKIRRGDLRGVVELDSPPILGRDVSGEVLAVGADVAEFKNGDRVMGLTSHTYAELVATGVDDLIWVPDGLDLERAATLPLVGLTGAQLVEEVLDVREGQRVLVTGALGSVGRVAVFAAKSRGAEVVAGVRARQREEAKKLGATAVVALDEVADVERLERLDAIADTVGGRTLARVLPRLRAQGVLGTVLALPPEAAELRDRAQTMLAHSDPKRLESLAESMRREEFTIPIGRRFPLRQASIAHELAETGGVGKILLLPAQE